MNYRLKSADKKALVKNQYGEYLVNKRKDTGLLANFYEFISFEYEGEKEPREFLLDKLSPICEKIENIELIGTFNHVFSHRIWEMESYNVTVKTGYSDEVAEDSQLWVREDELSNYPLVAAHQKILKSLK